MVQKYEAFVAQTKYKRPLITFSSISPFICFKLKNQELQQWARKTSDCAKKAAVISHRRWPHKRLSPTVHLFQELRFSQCRCKWLLFIAILNETDHHVQGKTGKGKRRVVHGECCQKSDWWFFIIFFVDKLNTLTISWSFLAYSVSITL